MVHIYAMTKEINGCLTAPWLLVIQIRIKYDYFIAIISHLSFQFSTTSMHSMWMSMMETVKNQINGVSCRKQSLLSLNDLWLEILIIWSFFQNHAWYLPQWAPSGFKLSFRQVSNWVTDYIQKRRGEPGLFSFEYNLLPKLISK